MKNELDRWLELKEWLERKGAKLVWQQKEMTVAKFGPVQQDCWIIESCQVLILYWPTSWQIYTSVHTFSNTDRLLDADARLQP